MKREKMDLIVEWLASECKDAGEDLDSLEGAVVERLRQLGQRTLQRLVEEKKGAMREPDGPADVGSGPASSAIAARRC